VASTLGRTVTTRGVPHTRRGRSFHAGAGSVRVHQQKGQVSRDDQLPMRVTVMAGIRPGISTCALLAYSMAIRPDRNRPGWGLALVTPPTRTFPHGLIQSGPRLGRGFDRGHSAGRCRGAGTPRPCRVGRRCAAWRRSRRASRPDPGARRLRGDELGPGAFGLGGCDRFGDYVGVGAGFEEGLVPRQSLVAFGDLSARRRARVGLRAVVAWCLGLVRRGDRIAITPMDTPTGDGSAGWWC
jgi:hypothetical protein